MFRISLQDYAVVELTYGDPYQPWYSRNSSTAPRAWFCQAENFLIIQNGQDPALIYDGETIRQSKGQDSGEVPTGDRWLAGAVDYGLLATGVSRWRSCLPDGTRAAVLKFTENDFSKEAHSRFRLNMESVHPSPHCIS
jgi:hypothetical protein